MLGIVTNRQLQQQLGIIAAKVDILMSQSDQVAADVATIEQGVAALSANDATMATAVTAVQAEIDALKAQIAAGATTLDLTALDQAAADVKAAADANSAAVASVSALAPPAA
jgi:hypothetical protein